MVESVIESPEGFSVVKGGVDGEAAIVERELGVGEVEREDLVEKIEISVEVREFEEFGEFSDDFGARVVFLQDINSFSDSEIGNIINTVWAHEKEGGALALFRDVLKDEAQNDVCVERLVNFRCHISPLGKLYVRECCQNIRGIG